MPRGNRMLPGGCPTVYHVVSRSVLGGLPITDLYKDQLRTVLQLHTARHHAEVLGFCLMGDHFHLLARLRPGTASREGSLPHLLGDIKQHFARFYNREQKRGGFFWNQRFTSVIVEDGLPLLLTLAYIDLNPWRAGLVRHPAEYRWSSLGCHELAGNAEGLLSLDYGPVDWSLLPGTGLGGEPLDRYRALLEALLDEQAPPAEDLTALRALLCSRSRTFTDSGILGSAAFVRGLAEELGLAAPGAKAPRPVRELANLAGLGELCTLRRSRKT